MDSNDKEICKKVSKKIIEKVEKKINLYAGKTESGKFIKIGADGTPTKHIDLVAEKEVVKVLKNMDFVSFLISEEIGEVKLGNGTQEEISILEELSANKTKNKNSKAKFIFLVDPLDGTNNAIKKIPAYGMSIAIAEVPEKGVATLKDVKIAYVKNFDNGDLYEAIKGEGAKLNGTPMSPSNETNLSNASVGGYIKGPSTNIFKIIKKIRRVRLMGSVSLELCFVANGRYDVFMDMRKSRIMDIAASKLIVEEAGAIVTDHNGKKLKNKLAISEKTFIVGAANEKIHSKIIQLSSIDSDKAIKTVGIISRLDLEESILFAGKIVQTLLKQGIDVKIEKSLAIELEKLKNSPELEIMLKSIEMKNPKVANEIKGLELEANFEELGVSTENLQTDMIITLGGDGTILRTQNHLNENEIPIFGINMGTVGFLTEIEVEDTFDVLEAVLRGDYSKEKRTQLLVSHEDQVFTALNEVVIMTEKPAKMLHFEIQVDGEVVEEFRADGLILSTPSGSTAYSMSAGGPIVDPKVEAFIIIPICPYKLGLRAFIVSDESEIKVKLLKKGKKAVFVMDGHVNGEINYLEEINFKKSKNDVYFLRINDKEFYQKVKEKLTEGGI
ncbi:MAG: bifunctional NADP phosphatase/NAD kinase [Methanobacteriaceae archaeon]|nr:bifunctional NADP phosphatase/NAD kinase [Candidatus Methanorudis spinitermitis]